MITPVLISQIGWGTYLFFGALNAMFIPFIYFFYPETAGRSLEEIDLIFAKGYVEKISYVKAAQDLPSLDEQDLAQYAREHGYLEGDEESNSDGSFKEKSVTNENLTLPHTAQE
jgi:hypothetical protein